MFADLNTKIPEKTITKSRAQTETETETALTKRGALTHLISSHRAHSLHGGLCKLSQSQILVTVVGASLLCLTTIFSHFDKLLNNISGIQIHIPNNSCGISTSFTLNFQGILKSFSFMVFNAFLIVFFCFYCRSSLAFCCNAFTLPNLMQRIDV